MWRKLSQVFTPADEIEFIVLNSVDTSLPSSSEQWMYIFACQYPQNYATFEDLLKTHSFHHALELIYTHTSITGLQMVLLMAGLYTQPVTKFTSHTFSLWCRLNKVSPRQAFVKWCPELLASEQYLGFLDVIQHLRLTFSTYVWILHHIRPAHVIGVVSSDYTQLIRYLHGLDFILSPNDIVYVQRNRSIVMLAKKFPRIAMKYLHHNMVRIQDIDDLSEVIIHCITTVTVDVNESYKNELKTMYGWWLLIDPTVSHVVKRDRAIKRHLIGALRLCPQSKHLHDIMNTALLISALA